MCLVCFVTQVLSTLKPVKPPHDEGVTLAQTFEASLQLRPPGVLAGGLFLVNLTALGPLQSVPLQIQGLVFGRDTGVADAHVPNFNNLQVFRT